MRKVLLITAVLAICVSSYADENLLVRTLQKKDGLSANTVNCIYQSSRGDVFVGTADGLSVCDGYSVRTVRNSSMDVTALCQMKSSLYVGTENGLYLYDSENDSLEKVTASTKYGVEIYCRVNSLVCAGDYLIAATEGQGVFLYDPSSGRLEQYSRNIPFVSDIVTVGSNSIIMAEREMGIVRVTLSDFSKSVIAPIRNVTSIEVFGDRIWYISRDGAGWVDSDGGMHILKEKAKAFSGYGEDTVLMTSPDGIYVLSSDGVVMEKWNCYADSRRVEDFSSARIVSDKENGLWVPLSGSGLIRIPYPRLKLDFDSGQGASDPSLCKDHSGNVYRVDGRHIFKYDIFNKTTGVYLIDNSTLVLFCDRDGTIWAGTKENGFFRLEDKSFHNILCKDSDMPISCVYAIKQDNAGKLWLSCNLGIVRVNPDGEDMRVVAGPEIFPQNWTPLPDSTPLRPDGTFSFMYEGFAVVLNPDDFITNDTAPRVNINSISFRNGSKTIWNPDIEGTVTLPYSDNSFTVHFSLPDYACPEANRYSYMLEGEDKSMSSWSAETAATFNNLAPGRYVFRVVGMNGTGSISPSRSCIEIDVTPQWWNSAVARVIYALILLSGAFATYRYSRSMVRRKYERQVSEARKQMEIESYRQRMNLVLGMVHEIRTPLTMIKLSLDRLASSGRKDKESINTVNDNLDYINETVNGILTYHNTTDNNLKLNFKQTDIAVVCSSVAERFMATSRLKKVRFESHIPQTPVFVMADGDGISRIFVNLLSNAFKYAENEVIFTLRKDGEDAVVSVCDDGPGVTPSEKEKIFGMFYKVEGDKVAESSGMGIGLAYARQLAQTHGGSLVEENLPSGGAEFIFRMPLFSEFVADKADDDRIETKESSSPAFSGASILVVDDNVQLLDMLEKEFVSRYSVHIAGNGKEALNVLESYKVDVIVSDVMMPVMDGLELCRRVKSMVEYSHIPFIMLTAKISVDAKTDGMECGADAYVEKPFSIRQIVSQIENLLRLKESYRQAVMSNAGMGLIPVGGGNINRLDADFVDKINAAIEFQIGEDAFSIDALAEAMCMSKSNFYKKFHSVTGMSPNEYLKNFRLNRAAKLIAEGAKINEAAVAVGFYSSSYFAKCFFQKFGVLPKDYKQ